jgi:hypothetical protein
MARNPDAHPLETALHVAAGHTPASDLPADLPADVAAWLPYARRLLAARTRLDGNEACPRPVLRRSEALFAERRSKAAVWAEMVFDSLAGLTPAVRGTRGVRMVEYRSPSGSLQVQLRVGAEGTRIHMALGRGGLEVHVDLDEADHPPFIVRTDRHGVGWVDLPPGAHAGTLRVVEDGRELFRAAAPTREA